MTDCLPTIKERLFPCHRNRAHIIEDIFEALCASIYNEVRWKEAVLKPRIGHVTPERRTSTSNNAISVVSLDTISYFHLIDYLRFWDGSCHAVAMVKMQVTRVICSEILIKDWLIMFIAVVSPPVDHGGKPTAIYWVVLQTMTNLLNQA